MMNPWLLLGLAIAWGASVAGAAWTGKEWAEGQAAQEKVLIAKVTDAVKEANQNFADTVGTRIETGLSKIRITNVTNQQDFHHEREIQTRVLDNPDCASPATSVVLLNRARGYRGEEGPRPGEPALRMPAAAPPPRSPATR